MSSAVFTPEEAASAIGGVWSGAEKPRSRELGIFTDTRQDGSGKIFFALAGETFDAHDFLFQAQDAGAAALCIREDFTGELPALPLLKVKDTLAALQSLAAFHRSRFPELKVTAVTGSVGKTSVKEMLRAIFTRFTGSEDAVLYTEGNTNNQFGVPRNLFKLNSRHRFAVLEAGTSSPGEILPLARMIRPDAAVVNSIAPCHLEKLGDLAGVAREKGNIYAALSPDGVAVMGKSAAHRDILESAAAGHPIAIFAADDENSTVWSCYETGSLAESTFTLHFASGSSFRIKWKLTGEHQALNAAAAAAAALALGIPEEVIAAGLPDTVLPGQRMKQTSINGVDYVNDAYNANPASMRAIIKLMTESAIPAEKFVLVLGGMRELGENSPAEHIALLELVRKLLPGVRLITTGAEFAGLPGNGRYFPTSPEAAAALAEMVRPGDTVVAKGSNGNHVELALPEAAR